MTIIQAILFFILVISEAAILMRLYPIVVHKMTAEQYWERNDWYETESEMSDERLFNKHKTPVEIIDVDGRQE